MQKRNDITVGLLKLAAPVVASQASGMMVTFADTFMTARLGEAELGAVAFSSNLMVPFMFFGIGVATSVTPLIGRRYGRGDKESIGKAIGHAREMNIGVLLLQLLAMGLIWAAIPHMGQPAEVERMSLTMFPILMASMLGQQMYAGLKTISDGLQDTRTPMTIAVTCNIINIIGNYILIFGIGGWTGLGAYGAAVSTLIARTLMWIMMEIGLSRLLRKKGISVGRHDRGGIAKTMFESGLPVGMQSVVECMGFTVCGIMMGWIGEEALAAHQVVNMYTSLTYLLSSGIATAVTIKVAVSCGANDPDKAWKYSVTGLKIVGTFMASMAILFIMTRDILPGLSGIKSEEALATASGLMMVGAMFQMFDGLQVTAIGALRGYGDLRYPAIVAGIAFAGTCIPTGYVLGFIAGYGGIGIWVGLCAGLMVASGLLLVRLKARRKERTY